MTLNLATIFGDETNPISPVVITPVAHDAPVVDMAADPNIGVMFEPWPIVGGTEHFSIWVDDPAGQLPEFIPGHHYDIRQPSQLRPLLSPRETTSLPNSPEPNAFPMSPRGAAAYLGPQAETFGVLGSASCRQG